MARTVERVTGALFAALLWAGGLSGGCATPREVPQPPVSTAEVPQPPVSTAGEEAVILAPGQAESAEVAAANAMSRITSARDALERGQVTHAQELIEASLADMDHLFTWLPEEPLYGAVDTAVVQLEQGDTEVELGPLEERLLARREYLPAGIVEDVQAARMLVREGRPSEALELLREVRQVLANELLVLPVDEARARVRQAALTLEAGQPAQALSWLAGVPELLEEVRAFSPLVPARWRVRAAAESAARGEWERSEALMREAVEILERYRGTMHSPLTPRVERLEADARLLLRRMDGLDRPSLDMFFRLAERMGPITPIGGSGAP